MNPEQWLSLKWNGGSTMSDRWLNQSKIIHRISCINYFLFTFNKKKAFTSMANNKSLFFNNYCKIISCLRKYFNFKDKKFFILQCFIFYIVIIQNITYNI